MRINDSRYLKEKRSRNRDRSHVSSSSSRKNTSRGGAGTEKKKTINMLDGVGIIR